MRRLYAKLQFVSLAIHFFLLSNASAATINASSCSDVDVSTAISAASNGDKVVIPAGTCTWAARVSLNKNITLQGAGSQNTQVTWNSSGYAIFAVGTWRITGIGFTVGPAGSGIVTTGPDSSSVGWRVDYCTFTASSPKESITIYGAASAKGYGLADHNTHTNCRAVLVYGHDCQNPSKDFYYTEPQDLGTANAVYVENSTIINTVSANNYEEFDQNCGGRVVFRYNVVNNWNFGIHSVQGGNRAARSWEIYNNTFNSSNFPTWVVGHIRGGTGVIFNNTIGAGFGSNIFLLDNVRSCESRLPAGICDGTSSWDGNRANANGYPCRDQIGRSTDAFQWGAAIPSQELSPAYFWNNKKGTTEVKAALSTGACTNLKMYHILENRDFYNYAASFNGTAGVGVGLLANRPMTCTTNADEPGGGVGYWATDTNTLYRCSATNTWTVHYRPYTYPHPLGNLSGSLEPPQGLQIK